MLDFSLFSCTYSWILIISDDISLLLVQFFFKSNRAFKIPGNATCNSKLAVGFSTRQQQTVLSTDGATVSAANSELQRAKVTTVRVSAF